MRATHPGEAREPMSFLQWLQDSSLGQLIASSSWANLILLCFHALGMSVLVGVLWMLSLRTLGLFRGLPFEAFRPLMGLAWLGFFINAVSGVLMFTGAGPRFIINTDFQLKMLMIALGGLSVLVLRRTLRPVWPQAAPLDVAVRASALTSVGAKTAALLCLLFWLAVILFGRQIAYTLARPVH